MYVGFLGTDLGLGEGEGVCGGFAFDFEANGRGKKKEGSMQGNEVCDWASKPHHIYTLDS